MNDVPEIFLREIYDAAYDEMRGWLVEPAIGRAGSYTVTPTLIEHRRILKDAGKQWEWTFASMEDAQRFVFKECLRCAVVTWERIRPRPGVGVMVN